MAVEPSPSPSTTRRLMWVAGIACVACCSIPWLGLVVGSAALAGLAAYAEPLVWGIAALGLVVWMVARWMRPPAPQCKLEHTNGTHSKKWSEPADND